jgi:hypothetical protein
MSRIVRWRSWPLSDGPGAPGIVEIQQPSRAPTIESDFSVPALQAILTGVVVGTAAAAVITLLWHTSLWPVWPAAVAIVSGGGWLWRMSATSDTLFRTESLAIDQAPAAPPAPRPGLLLANPVECASSAAVAERTQHEAARRDAVVAFVRRCAVRGCGESSHNVTPGTRAAYLSNRDLLFSLGLARWRSANHKAGWELSCAPSDAVVLLRRHTIGR